uniref:Uncharacterized protein n=1 Tax=Phytophthora ramorum TaxID=164328 RepID=H3GQC6_PHYRM
MDGMRRGRARDNYNGGGYSMDFSSSFHRSKRPRSDDPPSEEEKENAVFAPSTSNAEPPTSYSDTDHLGALMRMTSTATSTSASPWRLPSNQTLEHNQQYLNEQLQHVVALSSVLEPRNEPENGTRRFLAQDKRVQDDVDKVCNINLASVWTLLTVGGEQQSEQQKTAEKRVRDVMDLVSYLLYVRDRELDHQNRLSESLGRLEKQLERKNHIVQTLTSDLETLKQNSAQKENVFKAKEKASITERKTLQVEKKALEVNCARLQGVETAYKAQLRRKDVDYARLKKSLQDAVARSAKEKRRDDVQGMAIAKTLNGVRERKQVSTTGQSKEAKLTKQIMENLEQKKAELLFDNEALARRYDKLQHQLESLTSQYKKAVQLFLAQKNLEGDAEELEKLASAPIDDFTPTPFNMATKEGIPQYISQSMEVLNDKLKQLEHVIRNELPSAEARSDKEVNKRLRQKLDDAHAIIKEQDQLLQASLSSAAIDVQVNHGKSNRSIASKTTRRASPVPDNNSPDADAQEYLNHEKGQLAVLRENLEKERRLLQEQAVKLDKDRLEFEQQRRAKRWDLDGPDSPFDIPVSATPGTAALLKKIGINVPTEK